MRPLSAMQILKMSQSDKAWQALQMRNQRAVHRMERAQLPKNFDLGPWVKEMAHCLIRAQGYAVPAVEIPEAGRILIGPDQFTDSEMQDYLLTLAPYAVANPLNCRIESPSPHLVPYLLGGISLPEVERQCYRALTILDAFPVERAPVLSEALIGVGFGAHINHALPPCEIAEPRLSVAVNFLRQLPTTQSNAYWLLEQGAAGANHARRAEKVKERVLRRATQLLTPGTDPERITKYMASRLKIRPLTDADYRRTLKHVYQFSWQDLNLGATQETVESDIEVVIARCMILEAFGTGSHKTKHRPKISGQTLVGLAMLTGISVAKFTDFAVKDLRMRGETFLSAECIDEAIEIISSTELAAWNKCEAVLRDHAAILRYPDLKAQAMAQRLRSLRQPLWTTGAESYYMTGPGEYSHKPERLE